jgi:hypothetical protein
MSSIAPRVIHLLWNGQSAVRVGTRAECIRAAEQEGLVEWREEEQLFCLKDGADINVYPLGQVIRWFDADDLKETAS